MKFISLILCTFLYSYVGMGNTVASDWMHEYKEHIIDKPLNEIYLPGSHDSAMYKLEDTFGKNQGVSHNLNILKYFLIGFAVTEITKDWSKTQEQSILEQLENGVRYLDLRIIYRDSQKDFYTVHGLYGPSLGNILNQIDNFLTLHPKEIIIIQIGDLRYMPNGDTDHQNLINRFQDIFEDKLITKPIESIPTIRELWKHKKQIVLIYENETIASQYDTIWPKSLINSFWANSDKLAVLKARLDLNLQTEERKPNQFFVIQTQLTPVSDTIKSGLCACSSGYKSLKDMAIDVEQELPNWLTEWQNYKPSIIITDFANAQINQRIIDLNKYLPIQKSKKTKHKNHHQKELESIN